MQVLRNTGMGLQNLKSSYFGECGGISVIISYYQAITDLTTNKLCSRNASSPDFLGVFSFLASTYFSTHAEYFV